MGKRKVTNINRGRTRSKKKTQQQQDKTQQHITKYFTQAKPKPKTKPKRKDHTNKATAARIQQSQTILTGHTVPKPHQRAGNQFKLTKPPNSRNMYKLQAAITTTSQRRPTSKKENNTSSPWNTITLMLTWAKNRA